MIKLKICVIFLFIYHFVMYSQQDMKIRNLQWEEGSNVLVTLENDSGIVLDINELFHSNGANQVENKTSYTYYPVVLGENFINQLKEKNITTDTIDYDEKIHTKKYGTLWSGIHTSVGGGYIHFMNTILYGLESGQLDLYAPLLKRPESKWKPKPMTESFKRTKKWDYYIPESQKLAIKEYKLKEKEGKLGDIVFIPQEYIQLFLETNDKEYREMRVSGDLKSIAKIDLIKLLIGANYLGIPQIHYIRSMVLKSILEYSISNPLPSIIVFDDIQAAVAMKLDSYGYHIQKVAFKNEHRLSEAEYEVKMKLLNTIVSGINEINKKLFEKRLGNYYK